ncbi:MAG: NAD-dependent epimerase/dehydratase family protein, partial [Thermodesulfobacteriota bacterium]|nr:NAD-dependent epimerase/dehydratase family protein [Thermodesulfobacteriota bacterium]
MKKAKRILVTGGAGYIGSVLSRKLVNLGYWIVILDNFSYTDMGIKSILGHPRLTVVNGDIRDVVAVRQSLKDADCVIHLAAVANDPSGQLDPRLTREVNYEAYGLLLDEAKRNGATRFLNASTFGVYGKKDGINITEEEPLNPLKEYSVCKAKSETIVKDYNDGKFTTLSLRCATVCGWSPRMRFDLIVNTLTFHAIINNKITVWGGQQKRPQIHVDDITDYFVQLIDMPARKIGGKIYNAGGQNATILEIAQQVREVMARDINIVQSPPREDERTYHVSSDRIAKELGLTPKKDIKDAIASIIEAYEHGLWKDPDWAV